MHLGRQQPEDPMHRSLVPALLAAAVAVLACGEAAEEVAAPAAELSEWTAPAIVHAPLTVPAPGSDRAAEVNRRAAEVEEQVVAWRRHIHQHPELSNREFETAALVAGELTALELDEVRTGVAHTGVVGVLRGGRDGPVVALRADMDALPVTEETDLPFASKVRTTYDGREVGVMHACGHDAHVAILLGTARVLAGMRAQLPGTVLFVFQPAEEGAPKGEEGGARLMLEEGAFDAPVPDAVFGLHATPDFEVGTLGYRSGGVMASSDRLEIVVRGSQTHAAYPWRGVDPVAAAARVVLALREIPARRVDARVGSIVSIGSVHGGVRHNIIPDEVVLKGTMRSLDPEMRFEIHQRVRETAKHAAAVDGASAEVEIALGYPVTYNDPILVERMLPSLVRSAGAKRVKEGRARTGAEDFSFFAQKAPGFYFWLGTRSPDVAAADAAPNHSPRFLVDERALGLGVRAMVNLAFDYLEGGSSE